MCDQLYRDDIEGGIPYHSPTMIWFPATQLLAAPLAKVPLLLTATRLTALAMTPPTPPPSTEETKGYQGVKDPMKPLLARSGYIYKVRRVSKRGLT